MRKLLSDRKATALLLVFIGIVLTVFGPWVFWWATAIAGIVMIGYALYSFYKKNYDAGIIGLLIGIGLIIVSRFTGISRLLRIAGIGCLAVGIVMYLVYLISEK